VLSLPWRIDFPAAEISNPNPNGNNFDYNNRSERVSNGSTEN